MWSKTCYCWCQWSKFCLFLTTDTTFVHLFHPCSHVKIAWLSFSQLSHSWKNFFSRFPQRSFFCWPNFSVAANNNLCKEFHHQDKKTACSVEVWLKKKCIKRSSLQQERINEASSMVIYYMQHKLRNLAS